MSAARDEHEEAAADIAAVERANTAFYEAMERGDLDELSGLWLPGEDLTLSCVHPGWPVLTGRGDVLRSYALIMANTEYIQFFLTDVGVSMTGDTALVTCTENILSGAPPRRATPSGPSSDSSSSPPMCSGAHRTAGSSGPTTARPYWPKPVRKRTKSRPSERPERDRGIGPPDHGVYADTNPLPGRSVPPRAGSVGARG